MRRPINWRSVGIWTAGGLLLLSYILTLYSRGNSWRWAPDLHIVVLSEPLAYMTTGIAGHLADVQGLHYPVTGTGERLRAEQLLSEAHIFIVPRYEDAAGLAMPSEVRVLSMQDAFSASFQYQLLTSNRQFFAYASPQLETEVLLHIRDQLVDVDVVRAGKYEVATKALRTRIKNEGSMAPQESFALPRPERH